MEKETEKGQEITTEARRKFLKTAGIFAVYAPPALMIMSSANVHAISLSNNGCGKASGNVPSPGNSGPNNNAQNAAGGQNCPSNSGKTF